MNLRLRMCSVAHGAASTEHDSRGWRCHLADAEDAAGAWPEVMAQLPQDDAIVRSVCGWQEMGGSGAVMRFQSVDGSWGPGADVALIACLQTFDPCVGMLWVF